jgi:pimeloyl-ACP methyl ester carboxylesterase
MVAGKEISGHAGASHLTIWQEALAGVEVLLLHTAPVYYGIGVPKGEGAGVVMIPGFLASDVYLVELYAWLRRIGYRPYYSGIGINNECPNLIIGRALERTIEQAIDESSGPIHIIGHSLGGLIARAVAGKYPEKIASVIMLGAPFRGTVMHPKLVEAVEIVRQQILENHGKNVLPTCYTGRCTCSFLDTLRRDLPPNVGETAIYTKNDGFVDWRFCVTEEASNNFEVGGTHVGLVFNPAVYDIIAKRLAAARRKA